VIVDGLTNIDSVLDWIVDAWKTIRAGALSFESDVILLGSRLVEMVGGVVKVISGMYETMMSYVVSFASKADTAIDYLTRPIVDLFKALGVLPQGFTVAVTESVATWTRDLVGGAGNAVAGMAHEYAGGLEAISNDVERQANVIGESIGKSAETGFGKMLKKTDLAGAAARIEAEATMKAGAAAAKAEKAGGVGGPTIGQEPIEKKHAGAYEVFSKEAYSAVLTARGLGQDQKAAALLTAKSTERTAKATEDSRQYLNSMAQFFGFQSEGELVDALQGA
jgi:hypothetical protein